jgi:hypothetical protein
MNREELMIILEEEECLIADDYNDCLIGITEGANPVAVYSTQKVITKIFEEIKSDKNYEGEDPYMDAIEHFQYNIAGSYVGEKTPVYINMLDDE